MASEYILNSGPRIRKGGDEAHQGYVMGPMAAFVFDTRSKRNYEANRDRLISKQQFEDFKAFLGIIERRSDIRIWNISGDIHVANSHEIMIPGIGKPIYQVTTSAITNRHHPPELVEKLTEIRDGSYIKGVGQVRRIWPTITDPNILCMRIGRLGAEMKLRAWSRQESATKELVMNVWLLCCYVLFRCAWTNPYSNSM